MLSNSELFKWARKVDEPKSGAASDPVQDDPIAALLQSNTNVFKKNQMVLSAGKIAFQKLPHANYGHEHESVLSSLCFHPRENLLLTTGLDRQAKLVQVAHSSVADTTTEKPQYNNVKMTQKSKKIAGIFLPDLPIYQGKFISGGDQLILTGNRKHFYSYDVAEEKL